MRRNQPPGLAGDNRGLAYLILLFGGLVIITSLLIAGLEPAFMELMDAHAQQTSSPEAATGEQWIRAAWNWIPVMAMALGAVMMIAGAVVESRGP